MKFIMIACNTGDESDASKHWEEDYDKDFDPGTDLEKVCRGYVENFNNTLLPHEKPRSFISVCMVDEDSSSHHRWEKDARQMSVTRKIGGIDQIVDGFYCVKCGIRGHRIGMQGTIHRDWKYRARKYADCSVTYARRVPTGTHRI